MWPLISVPTTVGDTSHRTESPMLRLSRLGLPGLQLDETHTRSGEQMTVESPVP